MRSAWMTERPTPPAPKTAVWSPGWTLARLKTEPTPVTTPQAIRQAEVSGTSLSIGTACTSLMIVSSAKEEVAAKLPPATPPTVNGSVPVADGLLAPGRVAGVAAVADAAVGDRADDDVVARLGAGDLVADRLDDAGALVAHHRRSGPRDGAVDDADVAVADAGGDDPHQDLVRPGLAYLDVVADLCGCAVENDGTHGGYASLGVADGQLVGSCQRTQLGHMMLWSSL